MHNMFNKKKKKDNGPKMETHAKNGGKQRLRWT